MSRYVTNPRVGVALHAMSALARAAERPGDVWRGFPRSRTIVPSDGGAGRMATMLFYCAYTWFPNTQPETVWRRVMHQHEQGANGLHGAILRMTGTRLELLL